MERELIVEIRAHLAKALPGQGLDAAQYAHTISERYSESVEEIERIVREEAEAKGIPC